MGPRRRAQSQAPFVHDSLQHSEPSEQAPPGPMQQNVNPELGGKSQIAPLSAQQDLAPHC